MGFAIRILLLAMLLQAAPAQTPPAHTAPAQTPLHATPFSADIEENAADLDGNRRDIKGKMYVSQTHVRMDMQDIHEPGHPPVILLFNPAAKTMDMLYPEQHKYIEVNGNQKNPAGHGGGMPPEIAGLHSNPCAQQKDTTCKNVGTEQVNGRACEHWQISDKNGKVIGNVWLDKSLHIPIKSVSQRGTRELTNVKEGEQPASLFKIPVGYRKLDLSGMMQGRQPQQ